MCYVLPWVANCRPLFTSTHEVLACTLAFYVQFIKVLSSLEPAVNYCFAITGKWKWQVSENNLLPTIQMYFSWWQLSISWLAYMTSWNMSHSQNPKASELFHINHVYFLWGVFLPRDPWLILYACLYPCFVAGEVEKLPRWQKSYVVLLNECDLSHAWSVFPPCPVSCSYRD